MRFSYETAFGGPEQALEPYERLIHDVMIGDRTFFTTTDGIERCGRSRSRCSIRRHPWSATRQDRGARIRSAT